MQETITLDLPVSKKQAVIRGYINGRDQLKLREAVFADGGDPDNINPAALQTAYAGLIESMLISLDGSADQPYDALLDLPAKDFDVVFNKVIEIQGDDLEKKD